MWGTHSLWRSILFLQNPQFCSKSYWLMQGMHFDFSSLVRNFDGLKCLHSSICCKLYCNLGRDSDTLEKEYYIDRIPHIFLRDLG